MGGDGSWATGGQLPDLSGQWSVLESASRASDASAGLSPGRLGQGGVGWVGAWQRGTSSRPPEG